ncbi:hypothetical protein H2200_010213 [Cladophialophora chaetospira]|uniref:Uncharacterized protein n=1 Tax=Cladophialophora chaetospira TaxID=386627 RepID=A0AA39CEQ9_9EURO|nr:hypothetical protein H2200_010213 [Cladophialophora chaetospira]
MATPTPQSSAFGKKNMEVRSTNSGDLTISFSKAGAFRGDPEKSLVLRKGWTPPPNGYGIKEPTEFKFILNVSNGMIRISETQTDRWTAYVELKQDEYVVVKADDLDAEHNPTSTFRLQIAVRQGVNLQVQGVGNVFGKLREFPLHVQQQEIDKFNVQFRLNIFKTLVQECRYIEVKIPEYERFTNPAQFGREALLEVLRRRQSPDDRIWPVQAGVRPTSTAEVQRALIANNRKNAPVPLRPRQLGSGGTRSANPRANSPPPMSIGNVAQKTYAELMQWIRGQPEAERKLAEPIRQARHNARSNNDKASFDDQAKRLEQTKGVSRDMVEVCKEIGSRVMSPDDANAQLNACSTGEQTAFKKQIYNLQSHFRDGNRDAYNAARGAIMRDADVSADTVRAAEIWAQQWPKVEEINSRIHLSRYLETLPDRTERAAARNYVTLMQHPNAQRNREIWDGARANIENDKNLTANSVLAVAKLTDPRNPPQ